MTSIEWLVTELYQKFEMTGSGLVFDEILDKAKEMHKQEMIQFAEDYSSDCTTGTYDGSIAELKSAEQYYNETFKNK